VKNPHERTAVRFYPQKFYNLVDSARKTAGHTWPQVTHITGVGIDVFRRLRTGAELRLPAYLSLATYARVYLADQGDAAVQVDLPGTVGDLYDEPAELIARQEQAAREQADRGQAA